MMLSLHFTGTRLRRPPMTDLLFDARLENPTERALWFVLPGYLTDEPQPLDVCSTEILEWNHSGRVRIARLYGSDLAQVLCLAPGTRVILHEFPVTAIQAPPLDAISLSALVAERLSVGPDPIERWLPLDITCVGQAEASMPQGEVVAAKQTLDRVPVRLLPSGESRLDFRLPILGPKEN